MGEQFLYRLNFSFHQSFCLSEYRREALRKMHHFTPSSNPKPVIPTNVALTKLAAVAAVTVSGQTCAQKSNGGSLEALMYFPRPAAIPYYSSEAT